MARSPKKSTSKSKFSHRKGLTLIETLIVLAIVAVLVLLFVLRLTDQINRGRDAERKADLERIKVSFEDYHNDNGCYPPVEVLNDCGGQSFKPYLDVIPCDPKSGEPYLYRPLPNCKGYRIHSSLENKTDPQIQELDCDHTNGCGYNYMYNYGISAGVPVRDPNGPAYVPPGGNGGGGGPSSSPGPTGPIYVYACDTAGTCNRYEDGHPFLINCPTTFQQTNCNNACGNPSNWCNG